MINTDLSTEAKALRKEYYREYHRKNAERLNEYYRNYRKEHPEKIREYKRNYWERRAESKLKAEGVIDQ